MPAGPRHTSGLTVSEEIKGLAAASGMRNPMLREDWRQPIRNRMIQDAKFRLLTDLGCPDNHAHSISKLPMAEVKARIAKVEAKRAG